MTDIRPSEQIDINMPPVQNPDRTWRKAEPHEKPQAYAIKQQEGESVVAITAEEKARQDELRKTWEDAEQRANEPSPWKEMSSAPKDRPVALLVDGKVTAGKWVCAGPASGCWHLLGWSIISPKTPMKWTELPSPPTEGRVDISGDPENYWMSQLEAVEFFRKYAPTTWRGYVEATDSNLELWKKNMITEAIAMGQPRPAAEGAIRALERE